MSRRSSFQPLRHRRPHAALIGRALAGLATIGAPCMASAQQSIQAAAVLQSWPLAETRDQAIRCLTDAIVYEAATEPLAGQQAVAQVIMNRTRTRIFPASICGVVYQGAERRTGCQFTFTCDGSLRRRPPLAAFDTARPVAEAAFDGTLPDNVGNALFYHAHYVMPRWAPKLARVTRIGAHIFYRRPGGEAAPPPARPSGTIAMATASAQPFSPWGLPLATTAGQAHAN